MAAHEGSRAMRITTVRLVTCVVCWAIIGHIPLSEAQRVAQIGNEFTAGGRGELILGATFLLNDRITDDGMLFAFSAYVEELTRLRFQVWRPSTNSSSGLEYDLVAETATRPTTQQQREDFYIESLIVKKCAVVRAGDRLGIYFEELPWAVGYKFDNQQPATLQYKVENVSMPTQIFDSVQFDRLTFPYDFAVIAYLDREIDNITIDNDGMADCPTGLLIPDYIPAPEITTTPAPPITGAPGDTGPIGPIGATGMTGPIGPQGIPGNETWGHTGATGPMGATGPLGEMGATGEIGPMGVNGSTGEIGPIGPMGATGSTGPIGPEGPMGEKGDTPDLAPVYAYIDNETRKLIDDIPTPAAQKEEDDEGFWEDSDLVFYAYIWLAILTLLLIIFIILVIIVCCRVRRLQREYARLKKNEDYRPTVYDNPDLLATNKQRERDLDEREKEIDDKMSELSRQLSTYDPKPEWMNSMKPDQFLDYEVGTIERDASRRSRGSNSGTMSKSAPDLYENTAAANHTNGSLSQDELMNY